MSSEMSVENKAHATEQASPPARARFGAVGVLGLLLASVLTLVLVFATLASREPSWWSRCAATGNLDVLGSSAEHRVIAEASRVRDGERATWEVSLTQDECNAWLAKRFRDWCDNLDNDLAQFAHSHELRVSLDHESPLVGVRDDNDSILWANVQWNEESALIQRCGMGRVQLPGFFASRNDRVASLSNALSDAAGKEIRLPDGRRVKLVGIRTTRSGITLAGLTTAGQKRVD